MKSIYIDHISKSYNQDWNMHNIIDQFSYTFITWEFIGIAGPNGSGKTTLLQVISKLEEATSGSIEYSKNTHISYMFQDYRNALFPWMTVEENIGYPLYLQGYNKHIIKARITELIKVCNIEIDRAAFPYMLSGGKQQLTNILRSIITEPDFLLLDEPFWSLDYTTKEDLYSTIQHIFLKKNIGIILVSHDIDELIRLSQKIIILNDKPLSIKDEFLYNEVYPREKNIEYSSQYLANKKHILQEI